MALSLLIHVPFFYLDCLQNINRAALDSIIAVLLELLTESGELEYISSPGKYIKSVVEYNILYRLKNN